MRNPGFAVIGLGLVLAACGGPALRPVQAVDTPPSLASMLDAEAAARGRAIALVGCASCHAIDPRGTSPFAEAPPFRDIVQRRSLNDIETAMGQGLVTTHPAMPRYNFRAGEIDDLIAYMGSLQVDPGKS